MQSRRVLFWHMLKKLCIIFSGMQTYICIPYICTLHDFIWGSICNTLRGFTQIYIWYCHFRHGTVTVSRVFTGEDCQYIYLFILSKKQQETWIKKSNVAVLCLILQWLQQQRGSQVLDESLLDGWTHQSSSAKKVSLNITHAKKRVASSVKEEVPDVLPVKKPVTQFEVCSFNISCALYVRKLSSLSTRQGLMHVIRSCSMHLKLPSV